MKAGCEDTQGTCMEVEARISLTQCQESVVGPSVMVQRREREKGWCSRARKEQDSVNSLISMSDSEP